MKVYLDNCVVSAKVKKEDPDEMHALDELLDAFSIGTLDLVTSELVLKELDQWVGEGKGEAQKFYAILKKVPLVEDHTVKGFHSQWNAQGGCSYPLVEDEPVSSSIRKILRRKKKKNRMDAHHLMVAIKGDCDVFLTLDGESILKYQQELEDHFRIRLMKPSELTTVLSRKE